MTDEIVRKGPSGPPIDVFSPSPSDANSIPVVNDAGDGFDMLSPGTDGQIVTSRDGRWVAGDSIVDDPPALLVTIFGSNVWYAFAESQISESNEEVPKYRWVNTGIVNNGGPVAIAPDNSMFYPSGTFNGVVRSFIKNSGELKRYKLGTTPGGGTSPGFGSAFAGQAPATGLNPWVLYTGRATGNELLRWSNSGMQGSTNPNWEVPIRYTGMLTSSIDMAFDSAGNLWSMTTSDIQRYTVASVTGAAGPLSADVRITGGNWPTSMQGLAISAAGDLWVSYYGGGVGGAQMLNAAGIAAIVGAGPSNPVPTVSITSTALRGGEPPVFDYSGNLWIPSYDNTRVLGFSAADLTTSGAKTPSIILTGGGALGTGSATGPVAVRFFRGFGPLR